jgi:hypothetical protein
MSVVREEITQLVVAVPAGLMEGAMAVQLPQLVAVVAVALQTYDKVAADSITGSSLLAVVAALPAAAPVAAVVVIQMDLMVVVASQEMEAVAPKQVVGPVGLESKVETLERLEPLGLGARAAPMLSWVSGVAVGGAGTMVAGVAELMPIRRIVMVMAAVAVGQGLSSPAPRISHSRQACFLCVMGA